MEADTAVQDDLGGEHRWSLLGLLVHHTGPNDAVLPRRCSQSGYCRGIHCFCLSNRFSIRTRLQTIPYFILCKQRFTSKHSSGMRIVRL